MNNLFMGSLIVMGFTTFSLYAETNTTKNLNISVEHNNSSKKVKEINTTAVSKKKLTEEQIKEQMAKEAKYAKEMKFYQGDEYDLKAVEVNQKSLDHIPVIEPDYDFDITDVYRDDI